MRTVLAVLALTACVQAASGSKMLDGQYPLPEGYPPQIGTVTAKLGGVTQSWDTYDYSIGAFDAAVQITNYDRLEFRLMGDPAGKPDSKENRLLIKAAMTSTTQTGSLRDVVIEIVAGEDLDGPRLTSVGSGALVVLDSLTPMSSGSYGHVTGHFKATLCEGTGAPAKLNSKACQPLEGQFKSDLQIGGP